MQTIQDEHAPNDSDPPDDGPAGPPLPLDVAAVAHLGQVVRAFPGVTWQGLEAYVEQNFGWALAVPYFQAKMAELVVARSGQLPA